MTSENSKTLLFLAADYYITCVLSGGFTTSLELTGNHFLSEEMSAENKRIFLVACRLAHVSHIQAASLDELFELLLFLCQRRHFGCQFLSLAQAPLNFQQTAAPVRETCELEHKLLFHPLVTVK